MNDLYHEWGSDLEISSTGDLAIALGTDATRQRVCRRLLTNSGDYIWNLEYGAGLAKFVGSTSSTSEIQAVLASQLRLESAVLTSPPPVVSVELAEPASGVYVANVSYFDKDTDQSVGFTILPG